MFDLCEVRAALYGMAARFRLPARLGHRRSEGMLSKIDRLLADAEAKAPAEQIIEVSESIFGDMIACASADAQRMIEAGPPQDAIPLLLRGAWRSTPTARAPTSTGARPRRALVDRDADEASQSARDILYFMQGEVAAHHAGPGPAPDLRRAARRARRRPKRRPAAKREALVMRNALLCLVAAASLTAVAPSASAAPDAAQVHGTATSPDTRELLDYLRGHGSTGFIVIEDGKVLIDQTWPAPSNDPAFANFVYGRANGTARCWRTSPRSRRASSRSWSRSRSTRACSTSTSPCPPIWARAGPRPRPNKKRASGSSTS